MRTFDLAPLYRSTVGFDRLFSMLDGFESVPGYPPYNIERTAENDYRVTVAVAGFADNELSIEAKDFLIGIPPPGEEVGQNARCNLTESDPVAPESQSEVSVWKRGMRADITEAVFGAAE